MRFALVSYGTRGDVEPCASVALELLRRGHNVRIAVPPNLLGFVDSVGLTAVPYGPDSREQQKDDFAKDFWKMIRTPTTFLNKGADFITRGWAEMSATLATLARDADLIMSSWMYPGIAANVGEHYGIPVAMLNFVPLQVNSRLLPSLPAPLGRGALSAAWWMYWKMTKEAEAAQRRELGLPMATASAARRNGERGSLEIQAYDELLFPGLATEWAGRWPFVGALTMELATDVDNEVASWIAAGAPPIYFGFGSRPVKSMADLIDMISASCEQLGERALICTGENDFPATPDRDHVKVVRAVSHAATFPACRAVVHHGGAGTTSAGLRAGVPTLILWFTSDQPMFAAAVKRLNVGTGRRFSSVTPQSLVADLSSILTPECSTRAREIATRMSKPADSIAATADALEKAVRLRGLG
ncbi:glycosyl transferase [Mycobacterium persicum]|uniref:Glycosyl transferase n=1 Tax=Mycobacterium persicum TaxID=1487726 RepID=A0A8E2IW54_9MYCO|nr:glycosyltransferase [Mycobacterium persicum]KZS84198.1 glycosyl transferase [Mycobacterium persicum]ORB59223.1 glycosyl transferase [Mycobacterium persicum]ORB98100.1 glycosyl transferase [Mycobacterium persicum]ORC10402.1 glycosyl transferase [Mycobacterium persicum]VAZ72052.1 putative glycosyltransferase [Mycobacterium persicum]